MAIGQLRTINDDLLDEKKVYETPNDVMNTLPLNERFIGQKFMIKNDMGEPQEWWFADGIENDDLAEYLYEFRKGN